MASNKSNQNAKNGNVLVIALLIIVVAMAGVIVFLLTKKPEEPEPAEDTRATVVTEETVEQVLEEMSKPKPAAYYTCEMNVEWNFKDSSQPSYNAYVANAVENDYTVYFDVHLNSGEMVYSSPYIPVGEELTGITLEKQLAAGDYDAVVTYHLVDENHEELSNVSVSVVLHIEQ